MNPKQLNGIVLAYIGDAIYEVYVRQHLIKSGQLNVHELHNKAVKFVSASGQAAILHEWLKNNVLTEAEAAVVRRGRNAKSGSVPKNASVRDYRNATGFEALFGYLHLSGQIERLEQLVKKTIEIIEINGGKDEKKCQKK